MDIEARHSELRKQLDVLGFGHPLPLAAIGIVSAILDDLIQTSEKLKCSTQQIELLHQEKAAWELGVEPYKCDNSRLLAECNALHLELIQQHDKNILANTELRSRIRSLQAEKKHLEEKYLQAECKIRELQAVTGDNVKSCKDSVNKQRKPFISTVRAGAFYQPPKCCDQGMQQPGTMPPTCRCPCNQMKQSDVLHEVERLRVETANQQGVIDALKNQVTSRDREIQRLGALFAGGRPAAALAKDCCYRGVDVLGNDVTALQQEKLSLQQKCTEVQEMHERTSRKLSRVSEKNQQLEKELREFQNVALKLESEANLNILERDQKNADLQVKVQQLHLRVQELESVVELCSGAGNVHHISDSSVSSSSCPSDVTLQNALKQATEEKRLLYKQLNELKDREQMHLTNYEKIEKKYTKLKQKHSSCGQTQQQCGAGNSVESQVELQSLQYRCEDLEEKIRDMQQERDKHRSEAERHRNVVKQLKQESIEKDHQLAEFKSELHSLRKALKPSTTSSMGGGRLKTAESNCSRQSSLSVQAAIHRIERERDVAKSEVLQLEQERDVLREKLKLFTRSQKDELAKHENIIVDYSSQVARLESEKRDLQAGLSSAQTKVKMLKEESRELQSRVQELDASYSKLKISYSQLKILQEQTERALSQHQNRLLHAEAQLGTAESKLQRVDSTVEDAQKDVCTLKSEISILRASNAALCREKDKLLIELDTKTESLHTAELELKVLKTKKKELQSTVDQMQRKIDNVSTDIIHKESTLRSVSTETGTLKKQMATLQRNNDNASMENGRLSNELTDALAELTLTKRHLKDSQEEVEKMKTQLREYVEKMKRAEELLFAKEREREEMLERYRSLSEGVNVLETSNHTLEAETSEARKLLQEAEERISTLEELMNVREQNIRECEEQINELSASLAGAQSELQALRDENHALSMDLKATKELCTKLDLQKDKLNAELAEHSNIREQLAREKGTLQKELTLSRTGDRAAVEGLQELLAASRTQVEQQHIVIAKHEQDTAKMRKDMDSLRRRLAEEQETARCSEALASEYSVQLQEIRRRIMDERLGQIQSRTAEPAVCHDEDDDYDDEDGNRIRRLLEDVYKVDVHHTKRITRRLKGKRGKEMQPTKIAARKEMQPTKMVAMKEMRSSSVSRQQNNIGVFSSRGTQKSEPKLFAPTGWKITKYDKPVKWVDNESAKIEYSDMDESQDLQSATSSDIVAAIDGLSCASEVYTSISYDVIAPPGSVSSEKIQSETSSVQKTEKLMLVQDGDESPAGASGIVTEQMDGTGSTVVIYKTAAGERLILTDSRRVSARLNEKGQEWREHPTELSTPERNAQEQCASPGGVMIIDEPSTDKGLGAMGCKPIEAALNVRTTALVETWAKILHHQSPSGDETVKSTDGARKIDDPQQLSWSKSENQPTTSNNYHLRFHVKIPANRNKPAQE